MNWIRFTGRLLHCLVIGLNGVVLAYAGRMATADGPWWYVLPFMTWFAVLVSLVRTYDRWGNS